MDIVDAENTLIIKLAGGDVVIEMLPDVAPLHVERIKTLARDGAYDNVAFHRVLDGFVAQTGDVQFGDLEDGFNPALVGRGGSDLPDLPLELADPALPFVRAAVGMARGSDPDSANSQFFIMLADATLAGDFTVIGHVTSGMEAVDQIKLGNPFQNGAVTDPDRMLDVTFTTGDGVGLGLNEEEAQEIALLYEAGLDRDGEIDLPGLNFWIDAREGGLTVEETAQFFLDSPEFEETYGDPDLLTDQELVELLYQNVLDREGEEAGVTFWTGVVGNPNFSRAELLYEFAVSVENADTLLFIETLEETGPGDWEFLTA